MNKNFPRPGIVLSYSFIFFLQILSLKDDNTELEEADFEVSDIFTMLAHFAPQKQTTHLFRRRNACSSLEANFHDTSRFRFDFVLVDLVLEAVEKMRGKDAKMRRCGKMRRCVEKIFGATVDPYKFDKTTKSCS